MTKDLKIGWMNWDEIAKFLPQLIAMETDLLITYHYPNRKAPTKYIAESVKRLQQHMENGNTFIFGIRDEKTLYGYYWGYTSVFIDELRWHEHSRYLTEEIRGKGYGKLFSIEAEKKARSLGVCSMATSVATFNKRMQSLLIESGFEPTRVEMVKKL